MLRGTPRVRLKSMQLCIYCGCNSAALADEHIISEALGCKETLPQSVCADCNSRFGATFEAKAVNDLAFFRNLMRIPGKYGDVPDYRCTGQMSGRKVEVTFTGTGEVIIPTKPIGAVEEDATPGKQYIVFRKGEEHVIERNLRRKHGDLIWKRVPRDEGRATIEVRAEFDAHTLCSVDMNRTVAKFGFNLMARVFGTAAVTSASMELKRFIQTGEYDGTIPVGIIWDPNILRHVAHRAPKAPTHSLQGWGGAPRCDLHFSVFPLSVLRRGNGPGNSSGRFLRWNNRSLCGATHPSDCNEAIS